MRLSQKCCYALRALLELAKRRDGLPLSIAAIGRSQQIPAQFLQVIMRELRQGGFVESRRGKEGGYLLARSPSELSVGEVLRFLEGDFRPVEPESDERHHAFTQLWDDAEAALAAVYDGVTFAELAERDLAHHRRGAPDFVI